MSYQVEVRVSLSAEGPEGSEGYAILGKTIELPFEPYPDLQVRVSSEEVIKIGSPVYDLEDGVFRVHIDQEVPSIEMGVEHYEGLGWENLTPEEG